MSNHICSIFLVLCGLVSIGVSLQKRALPEQKAYSGLMSALCLDETGNIHKVCLQGISTRSLLQELFSRMQNDQTLAKEIPALANGDIVPPSNQNEAVIPQKRGGRDKISGFYSNW